MNPLDEIILNNEQARLAANKSLEKINNNFYTNYFKQKSVEIATKQKQHEQELRKTLDYLNVVDTANSERSAGEIIKDTTVGLLGKGALMVGQGAYSTLDLISEFNPLKLFGETRSLDEVIADNSSDGQGLHQDIAEARDYLSSLQSDKLNAQRQVIGHNAELRQQEANNRDPNRSFLSKAGDVISDFGSAVGDYIDNPTAALDTTLESAPQMLVPGAIAKGLVNKAGKKAIKGKTTEEAQDILTSKAHLDKADKIAERTALGYTALAEGTSNGSQIRAEILNSSHEDLMESSPKYAELLGSNPDDPEAQTKAKRQLAREAGLITTGLAGLIGGTVSKLTGAAKIEGNLFRDKSPVLDKIAEKVGQSAILKTGKDTLKEGVEETLQEAGGQFASNVGTKATVNPEQDLGEGVVDSAAGGLVAGALSAGPITGISNIKKLKDNTLENIGIVGKKINEKVKERVAKKTGVTPKVKEAIETGETEDILSTNPETGSYNNPKEAFAFIINQEPPKTVEDLKNRVIQAKEAFFQAEEALHREGATPADKKLFEAQVKKLDAMHANYNSANQKIKDNVIKNLEKVSKNPDEISPEKEKNLTEAADYASDILYSTPITSNQVKEKLNEEVQVLLDSGALSEEKIKQTEQLKDRLNTTDFNGVSEEFFNGVYRKGENNNTVGRTGLNKYITDIVGAIQYGNTPRATTRLNQLKEFQRQHTEKLNQDLLAYSAYSKMESDNTDKITPEENTALIEFESRITKTGTNYKMTKGYQKVLAQKQYESTVMAKAVAEMEGYIGNNPSKNESNTDTPVSENNASNSSNLAPEAKPTKVAKASKSTKPTLQETSNVNDVKTKETGSVPSTPEVDLNALADKLEQNIKETEKPEKVKRTYPVDFSNFKKSWNSTFTDITERNKKSNKTSTEKRTDVITELKDALKQVIRVGKNYGYTNKLLSEELITKLKGPDTQVKDIREGYSRVFGFIQNRQKQEKINIPKIQEYEKAAQHLDTVAGSIQSEKVIRKQKKEFKENTENNDQAVFHNIYQQKKYIDSLIENSPYSKKLPELITAFKQQLQEIVKEFNTTYDLRNHAIQYGRKQAEYKNKNTGEQVYPEVKLPIKKYLEPVKAKNDNVFITTKDSFYEKVKEEFTKAKGNPNRQRALRVLRSFHDKFVKTFRENFEGVSDNRFLFTDPINYFVADSYNKNVALKEEDLELNIISAMALVAYNWYVTRGQETVINTAEDISRIVNGRADRKYVPTELEESLFQLIGSSYSSNITNEFGPDILRAIGFKVKDTTPVNIKEGFINSFTNHAIMTLQQMDLIEVNIIPHKIIQEFLDGKTSGSILNTFDEINKILSGTDKALKTSDLYVQNTFVRVKTEIDENGNLQSTKASDTLMEFAEDLETFIPDNFGIEIESTLPSFEELPEKYDRKLRNTDTQAPEKVNKILNQVEKHKYGINKNSFEVFKKLSKEAFLEIGGYVEDFKNREHISQHKKFRGKNLSLSKTFDKFEHLVKNMPDIDSDMYFETQLWKMSRFGFKAPTNPQAHQLYRMMIGLKSNKVNINLESTEQVAKFNRAIAAGFGAKVERMYDEEITDFIREVTSDPLIAQAIELLQNNTVTDESIIVKAVDKLGEGYHSLHALNELAKFNTSKNNNESEYTTYYFREPDGITNGVASSLLQFVSDVPKTLKRLLRTGISADPDFNFKEYIKGKYDSYQVLAKEWVEGVNIFKAYAADEFSDYKISNETNTVSAIDRIFLFSSQKAVKFFLDSIDVKKDTNTDISEYGANFYEYVQDVQGVVGEFTEKDNEDLISSVGRALAKDPLMTNVYGASIQKIIENFVKNRMDNIYTSITKLVNKYKDLGKTTEENVNEKKEIIKEIDTIINNLNKLLQHRPNAPVLNRNQILKRYTKWQLDEKSFEFIQQSITNIYSPSLNYAIEQEFGDILEIRKAANESVQLAFNAFKLKYDQEYNNLVKELNRLPSTAELKKLNQSLLDYFPQFKTYFGVNKENGFIVTKQKKTIVEDSILGKTKSRVKVPIPLNSFSPIINNGELQTDVTVNRTSKTMSITNTRPDWEEPGVGGVIGGIHGIDSASMLSTLVEHEMTNIHDAAIMNILTAEESTEALNKNYFKVNKEYSVIGSIQEMTGNILKTLKESDPDLFKTLITNTQANILKNAGTTKLRELLDTAKINHSELKNKIAIHKFIKKNRINLFGPHLNNINNKLKDVEKNRKELFEQIKVVHQYNDGGEGQFYTNSLNEQSEANPTTEEIKQATEELINTVKDNSNNTDVLGSAATGIEFIDNFVVDYEKEITDMNVNSVYTELGRYDTVRLSDSHNQRLKNILNKIVVKTIEPLKLYVQRAGNETIGALFDGDIYLNIDTSTISPLFTNKMTKRETFVHELIHAVVKSETDGSSKAAQELKKLYHQVKNAKKANGEKWLTYKDFMTKGILKTDPNYKMEVALAKERYEYIFGNLIGSRVKEVRDPITGKKKKVEYLNSYQEFIAFALSNEAFIEKLSKFSEDLIPGESSNESLWDKIVNFFENILTKLNEYLLYGLNSKANLDEKVFILAGHLAGIDYRRKNELWQLGEKAADKIKQGLDTVVALTVKPLDKLLRSSPVVNSKNKAVQTIRKGIKVARSSEFIEAAETVMDNIKVSHDGFFYSIWNEMRGEYKDNTYIHDLSRRADNLIDRQRKKVFDTTKQFVKNAFIAGLAQDESNALYYLLKGDIEPVFTASNTTENEEVHYNGSYLHKLYSDDSFLTKEINKIKVKIRKNIVKNLDPRIVNWYENQATSMGEKMITGKGTYRVTFSNTRLVAELHHTGLNLPKGMDVDLAQNLISQLASLSAIKHINGIHKEKIANVIQREFQSNSEENGIITLLNLHKANKEKSANLLFNGTNDYFIEKGYIREKYAQNRSWTVAPASEEKYLKKRGFYPVGKVPIDKEADPNTDPDRTLYISDSDYMGRWISGVLSTTGKRHSGTTITKIYEQQGYADPYTESVIDTPIIRKKKIKQIREMLNSNPPTLGKDENELSIVFNPEGDMDKFVYKMNEESKLSLLKKDNSIDIAMASLESVIVDKVASEAVNRELIRSLYRTFKKSSNLDNFIKIGPDSTDPEHVELYRIIPDEIKKYINDVWKSDSMYVRAEDLTFALGEREVLLSKLEREELTGKTGIKYLKTALSNIISYLLNNQIGKHIEKFWKELIALAKDAIVIKSGVVLLGNEISNAILLKTLGVSIKDMFVYHAEAMSGLRKHRKDSEELRKLELTVRTYPEKASKHELRIKELKQEISVNPVNELIEAGLFQHIVEDIDVDREDTYQYQIGEWLKENKVTGAVVNNIPDAVKKVGKNLLLSHDTKIYQFLRDATQASDFVSRYVLHKHNMKMVEAGKLKMTPKESVDMITKIFINYTPPTHKYLQYLNDIGLAMFTKFFLRVQAVILYLIKNRPGSVLGLMVGEAVTTDFSDVTNSFLPVGIGNKIANPIQIMTEIYDSPLDLTTGGVL